MEMKDEASNKNEKVGLLFGYHKEMYRDTETKPSLAKQCCVVYCARGSMISWSLSFSIGIIIIGVLCTLYGYYLPVMYLSLSSEIDTNMTLVGKSKMRFEKEAKSLNKMYHDRDAFIISGLAILFLGGLVISVSLLLPLCYSRGTRGMEMIPSSSHITVKNELGTVSSRTEENCLNTYTEETYN